jgi:signal transduction histidine kinase
MARKDEFQTLAHAFNEMRQNLLDRDEQMQMMLRGIAHEVRNPLGGMELFSGLLAEELDPETKEAEYVQKIQKELGYLGRVVSDFLDYARRQPIELERLAAAPFLQEIVSLLAWDLDEAGVALELGEMSDDLELTLDKQRLRRVLINLVRNAGQASDKGGKVEMWARELSAPDAASVLGGSDYGAVALLDTALGDGESWRAICIRDRGRGIEPEKVDGIFTPFFTTKEKGSGLGLALARQSVEEHGGAMLVASTHETDADSGERGTLMVVLLPFVDHIERESMVVPEGWLG